MKRLLPLEHNDHRPVMPSAKSLTKNTPNTSFNFGLKLVRPGTEPVHQQEDMKTMANLCLHPQSQLQRRLERALEGSGISLDEKLSRLHHSGLERMDKRKTKRRKRGKNGKSRRTKSGSHFMKDSAMRSGNRLLCKRL